jgi:hypothetical protein
MYSKDYMKKLEAHELAKRRLERLDKIVTQMEAENKPAHPADELPTFHPKCICPYCNAPAVSLQAGVANDAVVWWCSEGHVSAGYGLEIKKNVFDFRKVAGENG